MANVAELPDQDAIIVGGPTRFGRLPSETDLAGACRQCEQAAKVAAQLFG